LAAEFCSISGPDRPLRLARGAFVCRGHTAIAANHFPKALGGTLKGPAAYGR